MAIDFMDFLKDVFEGKDFLNSEELKKVLIETNAYFESLETTLRYGDAAAKEKATAEALELKEYLDSKANKIVPFKGLDDLSGNDLEMGNEINKSLKISNKTKPSIKKLKTTNLS